jgi:hypothetical protein
MKSSLFVRIRRTVVRAARGPKARSESTGFVSDGFERVLNGIELEVRAEVEAKYADEWKASRLLKRWLLRQRMKREIAACVIQRSAHISEKSLF